MAHETRIIVSPHETRWSWRKWEWKVERRYCETSYKDPSTKHYGTWYEVAYGYASNTTLAEDRAYLWLAEEKLTKSLEEAKRLAAFERVKYYTQNTKVIDVEEN